MPELHILMTGLVFGESPRWHDNRLWFSDWGAQEVIAVDLDGKSEVITHIQSFPFGGRDMRTLFLVTREWSGTMSMAGSGARTGQVLTVQAPAQGTGWP